MRSRLLSTLTVVLVVFAGLALADTTKKVKLKGHLVDISCALEQKDDPDYMRTSHSKSCFQMPACVKSGYALLTKDDQVLKFDAAGNELAKKLIAGSNKDKGWRITVRGKQSGDQLQVTKIELER